MEAKENKTHLLLIHSFSFISRSEKEFDVTGDQEWI